MKDIAVAKKEAKEDALDQELEDFMAHTVFGERKAPNVFRSSAR